MDYDRGTIAGAVAGNWSTLFWRGVVAILFGLLALAWPGITLGVLLILFGVFVLIDGFLTLTAGLSASSGQTHRWALVLVGIAGLAAGVLTFLYPGITTLVLVSIIAAWAIITGVLQIIGAFRWPGSAGGRWLWAISGALSVLFGVLLYAYPLAGVLAVVWMIGFYALILGFTQIALGAELRGIATHPRAVTQP